MRTEGWKSTEGACAHLGVSKNSLYKLVYLGLVPAYRPTPDSRSLRFKESDLDSYLETRRVPPESVLHLLPEQDQKRLRPEGQAVDPGAQAGVGPTCDSDEGCPPAVVDEADIDFDRLPVIVQATESSGANDT
jgi:excisionase family DNA binding protein